MTQPDSDAPTGPQSTAPPQKPRRRLKADAGQLVDKRLGGKNGLQARYLRNESQGRADVAALRKAASRAPGDLPEVWSLSAVPVASGAGDTPTREEIAVHTAMTLYAVHQQSRTEGMFQPGVGLGQAARDLIGPHDQENPSARARFNALVTSTTVNELRHHLRSFISQLRARSIPLDHAMLADDLVDFQRPGSAKDVRLRWSRQYGWIPAAD
ncbi:CRISPR system Cascade subunit CasB [Actinomyces ruminicola]|uniref:CRISPR system Cascade subunit CasB n=1 Tax=Actinomyces ruminicola TaxID=332524 RepID=A0A1H0BPQ6_9ACTO|nr:type I-E CRISPR-associated protein Cse2/CasB [Actinomyces ruminicola]SDN47535.1 CRISPR system Cascade subunit CasB [Actinomyces ruminicola]